MSPDFPATRHLRIAHPTPKKSRGRQPAANPTNSELMSAHLPPMSPVSSMKAMLPRPQPRVSARRNVLSTIQSKVACALSSGSVRGPRNLGRLFQHNAVVGELAVRRRYSRLLRARHPKRSRSGPRLDAGGDLDLARNLGQAKWRRRRAHAICLSHRNDTAAGDRQERSRPADHRAHLAVRAPQPRGRVLGSEPDPISDLELARPGAHRGGTRGCQGRRRQQCFKKIGLRYMAVSLLSRSARCLSWRLSETLASEIRGQGLHTAPFHQAVQVTIMAATRLSVRSGDRPLGRDKPRSGGPVADFAPSGPGTVIHPARSVHANLDCGTLAGRTGSPVKRLVCRSRRAGRLGKQGSSEEMWVSGAVFYAPRYSPRCCRWRVRGLAEPSRMRVATRLGLTQPANDDHGGRELVERTAGRAGDIEMVWSRVGAGEAMTNALLSGAINWQRQRASMPVMSGADV